MSFTALVFVLYVLAVFDVHCCGFKCEPCMFCNRITTRQHEGCVFSQSTLYVQTAAGDGLRYAFACEPLSCFHACGENSPTALYSGPNMSSTFCTHEGTLCVGSAVFAPFSKSASFQHSEYSGAGFCN